MHAIQLGFAFVYLETKVESEKMADTRVKFKIQKDTKLPKSKNSNSSYNQEQK